MHTNIIVRGFITCALSLCLSGWIFVSSASAATIVVNTNLDVVDPPFNTGGLCGSGTIADLPGNDGKISLREAINAANNTPGVKSIIFALSPGDATIVLTGPLYLCGGQTTLNGDVNGDKTPDVTIDGAAGTFPFEVINIVSSHNTVKNLQVLAPPGGGSGISVSATPAVATTIVDNTIAHNIVSGIVEILAGADLFNNRQSINDVTIKHVRVRDNEVSGSPIFGILAGNNGDRNVLTDLTITGNTVFGNREGISVRNGWQNPFDPTDDGASDNRLDVLITDNTVTGNTVPAEAFRDGISIYGGFNFFSPTSVSSNNYLTAQVRGKRVENNVGPGIVTFGGYGGATDNRLDVTVKDNIVTGNQNPGDTGGIIVLGGFAASSNQVRTNLLSNSITNNNGIGISVGSGLDNSSTNDVVVTIRDNALENNAGAGIVTYGAIGALFFPGGDSSGNTLDTRIERNTVKNAALFGILVVGGVGSLDGAPIKVANNNAVTAVVTDNTVTGTVGEGMVLNAGGSGAANTNDVEVTAKKNTVCGSAATDIHAIGGSFGIPALLPPNQGTGNTVEGTITKNTATTVVVENGVAGNSATVTQLNNDTCP